MFRLIYDKESKHEYVLCVWVRITDPPLTRYA